ncbi:MAG: aminomethyl-transferring glycine dehydrogenase [Verrucomicrobiota bacterium]
MKTLIPSEDSFLNRHLGPSAAEETAMLKFLNCESVDQLIEETIPASIRCKTALEIPTELSEFEALKELKEIFSNNRGFRSYIGMGYANSVPVEVVNRNILCNPGWYTAYTPYQAEISQGRMEALLNFQTMICDLTKMEIANASMLDEATAAAEAMSLAFALKKEEKSNTIWVSNQSHPQTINLVQRRAEPLGIQVVIGDNASLDQTPNTFAALFQYPATNGTIEDISALIAKAHSKGALAIVATDLLSLILLKPPGECGADVVIGNSQRFGVPYGYGGPHAAFFATKDEFKRSMPGRLIGVSKDAQGKPALRLSLQTREQHIRREKATSNICTAQVLLAVIASMYAVYHGPEGLKRIANRVHALTILLSKALQQAGLTITNSFFFDTLQVNVGAQQSKILSEAKKREINFRILDDQNLVIQLDEAVSIKDLQDILACFCMKTAKELETIVSESSLIQGTPFERQSPTLPHPVFSQHHSETEMLRYIRKLEAKDLSLTTSMIPLGSCTMKLNATSEMIPITWPLVNQIHPFAPINQTAGYQVLFNQLEKWLAEITGFAAVSLQPNAGSQGEYAGLLCIHDYHKKRGDRHRNICIIPTSAHGTNPASAAMAGFKIVAVKCEVNGNIDVADLKAKATEHAANLGCAMITYPSTHGVFEESIQEMCKIIHDNGGMVYMDGANMNAMVGLCRPGDIGADVCHLNLHKTFCIPHGGGGPGMGPIGVVKALAPFLPSHPIIQMGGEAQGGAVSAAPWGSSSILPISWMYIRMLGPDGLKRATQIAILNANYIAKRLKSYFPVLYNGTNGRVAHECILDFRSWKEKAGIEVEDVAKRLMDYGFHAPTMSWPVPGTLMIEPTESESQAELDRFCDAMISIHAEMTAVADGKADRLNNPLKNAPHTAQVIISDKWDRPYPREQAAYPAPWTREHKYWPTVSRVDNVYGDRNLICSCIGMEDYAA